MKCTKLLVVIVFFWCLSSCTKSKPDVVSVVNYSNQKIYVATCSVPAMKRVICKGWESLSRDDRYRREAESQNRRLFVVVMKGKSRLSFNGDYEYKDFYAHGTGYKVSSTGSSQVVKYEWRENLFTYASEENRSSDDGPPKGWFNLSFYRSIDGFTSLAVHP